jgi:hypothetical protein
MVWNEQTCEIQQNDLLCQNRKVTHSTLPNCRGVRTQDELLGCRGEVCKTRNWEIFMVALGLFIHDLLSLDYVNGR